MARLLVIEDGHEYEEFARLFLAPPFDVVAAHRADEAEALAAEATAFLIDLRFERAAPEDLLGDVNSVAASRFGGEVERAARWLKEQQGTLILAALREAGHAQPAVFVHDFPPRRVANLRRLYGAVAAVPSFDARAILKAFEALA
ncbi:MAG: hypothetical protein AB8I08_18005 [Sandaracinaceae bacterium]